MLKRLLDGLEKEISVALVGKEKSLCEKHGGRIFVKKIFEYFYKIINCILPCVVSVILITHYGLTYIGIVLLLELMLLLIARVCRIGGRSSNGVSIFLTSVGIVLGAKQYGSYSPSSGLEVGVTILAVIIHAAIFLILSSLLRSNNNQ